jgi:hypothetical protein
MAASVWLAQEVGGRVAAPNSRLLLLAHQPSPPVLEDHHRDRQIEFGQVASSWMFMMMEPSPLTQTPAGPGRRASDDGRGRPKPMVPRPPEVSSPRGRRTG